MSVCILIYHLGAHQYLAVLSFLAHGRKHFPGLCSQKLIRRRNIFHIEVGNPSEKPHCKLQALSFQGGLEDTDHNYGATGEVIPQTQVENELPGRAMEYNDTEIRGKSSC